MNVPAHSPAESHAHPLLTDVTLFANLVHDLTQAPDLTALCDLVVGRLQPLLAVDRVLIVQVQASDQYPVVAEQVQPSYPSLLGQSLPTELVALRSDEALAAITAIAAADISQLQLSPTSRDFCEQFAVQAQLLLAIPTGDRLWGFLALHHCSGPRSWRPEERQWLQALILPLTRALHPFLTLEMSSTTTHSPHLDPEQLLTLIPDVMFILDRQGVYRQSVHHCLGTNDDAEACPIAGAHLSQFLDPEIAQRYIEACEQTLTLQTPLQYDQHFTVEGESRYEEVRMLPHGERSVFVIVRDITAKKLEELDFRAMQVTLEQRIQERTAALRATDQELLQEIVERAQIQSKLDRKNAELAAIFRAIPDAIIFTDPQHHIRRINPAFSRLFGYELNEIKGQPSDILYVSSYDTNPDTRDQKYPHQSLNALEQLKPHEVNYRRANGEIVSCETVETSVTDHAGNLLGFVSVIRDISERRRAQAALRESEVRFRTMADTAPVLIWMADAEQQFNYFNRGWLEFTGRTLAQEQGQGWLTGMHPEDQDPYQAEAEAAFRSHLPLRVEFRLQQTDGEYRWLLSNGTPRFWSDGQFAGYIGSCIDITTQKQLEQNLEDALSQEKELAQITLQSIGEGVITTNAQGRITYLNPVAAELTGWTLSQARNKPLPVVFTVIHELTLQPAENIVEQVISTGERLSGGSQLALVHRQGVQSSIEDSAAPIRDRQGEIVGAVLVFRDVTHARTLANQLSWQANHDALTGLMNRRYFEEQLTTVLDSVRQNNQQHVLCYLDLDQFKVVNDTCGHIAGDELLRQISSVIKLKIRATDALARLGGDEFGILLYHCPLDSAVEVAEAIRQAVYDFRFNWQGKMFGVGVSIGLVCLDHHSPNLASLLSAADTACYAAKDRGRNRVMVYQPDDSELVYQRQERRWSVRIRQAIESDRFRLLRQPIVLAHDPTNSAIPHYEVLLRMVDENQDLIPPSVFIPAAERYDLMPALDQWVIRNCFAHFAEHPLPSFQKCAINLSGASLNDDQFLAFLQDQFAEFAITPEQICFEITETTAIANLNQAIGFIGELKNLGCHFALDDFGSGMSSFGYLKSLPVDFLKIDGRFVKDIISDPTTYAIVESINHVGHVIGLQTIAECVEDEATIQQLQEIGIDYLQGYGTGQPEPWI
ncbi:MAG: EAL domain-containing protein [Spirulina sp. SIO3F2]|nr:EAL domain-containing protein [Spirulina sp. SIO3F2]